MENGLKRISDLFSGRVIFSIPKYQRAYSWEEGKQLQDFMDDLSNQYDNRDYFFGTILLQELKKKEGSFELIDVVDGQQRLTTTIIFMKVLISLLDDSAIEDKELLEETYIRNKNFPKLRVQQDDNDFFQKYILGDESGAEFIRTPSQRRLFDAKVFFTNELEDLSEKSLVQLKTMLDENTKVLTYAVKDTAEATLIFETTNDRGKKLTDLEKIKSFLMYKIYVADPDNPEPMLKDVQQRFSEIYREYEKINSILEEDDVLRYHYIAFEKWTDRREYQHVVDTMKKRINELIKAKKNEEALELIDRFSNELQRTFMLMVSLLNCKIPSLRDLFVLNKEANFFPLLLKTFNKDDSENKMEFEKICRLLEIFCFRVYSVEQYRNTKGQSQLYTLARDFKGSFLKLSRSLSTEVNSISRKFNEALSSLSLYDDYRGDLMVLKYLLWKYENYLREEQQPKWHPMTEEELTNEDSRYKFSIEHIVPQNPKDSKIVRDFKILTGFKNVVHEKYLHFIGNLTIDPVSPNSSKGNKDEQEKISKYFTKAPLKTQNELEEYLEAGKWTEESVTERANKILAFAEDHWNPETI